MNAIIHGYMKSDFHQHIALALACGLIFFDSVVVVTFVPFVHTIVINGWNTTLLTLY